MAFNILTALSSTPFILHSSLWSIIFFFILWSFAVYVVTLMWLEGIPEGSTVQAILHWFRNTAHMMYKMMGEVIREEGLDQEFHPTNYLNFFCLGNREVKLPDEYEAPQRPEEGSDYWNTQIHRSKRHHEISV